MSKIKWKKPALMVVWNKLETLRKEKNLTQVQLAVFAGVAITTIWMIEHGYDRATSKRTKQKFADFFKCTPSDLFPCEMIGDKPRDEYLKGLKKD